MFKNFCPVSDNQLFSFLISQVCKGPPQHEEICLGLFTLVLTEPAQAQKVSLPALSSRALLIESGDVVELMIS